MADVDPFRFIDADSARIRGFQSPFAAKLAQNEQFLRGVGANPNQPFLTRGGPRNAIDPQTGLAAAPSPQIDSDRQIERNRRFEEKQRVKLLREQEKRSKIEERRADIARSEIGKERKRELTAANKFRKDMRNRTRKEQESRRKLDFKERASRNKDIKTRTSKEIKDFSLDGFSLNAIENRGNFLDRLQGFDLISKPEKLQMTRAIKNKSTRDLLGRLSNRLAMAEMREEDRLLDEGQQENELGDDQFVPVPAGVTQIPDPTGGIPQESFLPQEQSLPQQAPQQAPASDRDQQALEWLRTNAGDPRAPAIRERLVRKGVL